MQKLRPYRFISVGPHKINKIFESESLRGRELVKGNRKIICFKE
jgi:hypothetical protein